MRKVFATTVFALAATMLVAGAATAQPPVVANPVSDQIMASARPSVNGSRLDAVNKGPGRRLDLSVHSAAMNTTLTVRVLRAADPTAPAPVLYLLNGAHGGLEESDWNDKTDVESFFADKQVTVVVPMGGTGTYFTDWQSDDPLLGRQLWKTFLTEELPPIIDSAFAGTGANAIAGISMAATSVFQLAESKPGFYRAVSSYSGCVNTSDAVGQAMVSAVVLRWSGNPTNMWGPMGGAGWIANDPKVHADRLAGTAVYVSAGSGLPGPYDNLTGPGIDGNAGYLVGQLITGGTLEAITSQCARDFQTRLAGLGIPATFNLDPVGTHSWGYWQDNLHKSWPMMADALAAAR